MINLSCVTIGVYNESVDLIKDEDSDFKLYKIQLSQYQEIVSRLFEFLTPPERNRANRYYFKRDRDKFVISRVFLKFLLAEYLDIDIQKVIIETDKNKKPYLPSHSSVFFNLSHARDYSIIALAHSSIGIDIEFVDKNFDFKEILSTIFNQSEIDRVFNSKRKHMTFFKFWTRKEAIVKATGKGIDDTLSDIVVLDGARKIPEDILGSLKTIRVFSFELNEGYMASVAITGSTTLKDRILFHPIPNVIHLLLNKK
jgi:4'-phosphopantetheinyl transferase